MFWRWGWPSLQPGVGERTEAQRIIYSILWRRERKTHLASSRRGRAGEWEKYYNRTHTHTLSLSIYKPWWWRWSVVPLPREWLLGLPHPSCQTRQCSTRHRQQASTHPPLSQTHATPHPWPQPPSDQQLWRPSRRCRLYEGKSLQPAGVRGDECVCVLGWWEGRWGMWRL